MSNDCCIANKSQVCPVNINGQGIVRKDASGDEDVLSRMGVDTVMKIAVKATIV